MNPEVKTLFQQYLELTESQLCCRYTIPQTAMQVLVSA